MLRTRVIPTLLLDGRDLVKTIKFASPTYIGDPINAIRIFNDKDVDEVMVLDVSAAQEKREPDFGLIREMAEECFMPMAYGGGLTSLEQIRRILHCGIEKIVINRQAVDNPKLVAEASREFGAQATVVSVDAKRDMFGRYKTVIGRGRIATRFTPLESALAAQAAGAGEILLNAVDRDGTMMGVDPTLIAAVAGQLTVPLIAVGGVGSISDMRVAVDAGASAVAAGAFFLFYGPHRAVLISYPKHEQLLEALS
jgi:imidazole glycerol-phosphate synthase subunit HisF